MLKISTKMQRDVHVREKKTHNHQSQKLSETFYRLLRNERKKLREIFSCFFYCNLWLSLFVLQHREGKIFLDESSGARPTTKKTMTKWKM